MDTETWRRKPCDNRSRDWNKTSTSQRTLRIARSNQKLEEARNDSSLKASEVAWLCQHLDFGFQPSSLQNCERINVCYFKTRSLCNLFLATLGHVNTSITQLVNKGAGVRSQLPLPNIKHNP